MDHFDELLAAASEGMRDVYGKRPAPKVGDLLRGMTNGKRWYGICTSAEPGRIAVECRGSWKVIDEGDLL